jgi:Cu(I)/Ag(I) efflux system membrane fusion protein
MALVPVSPPSAPLPEAASGAEWEVSVRPEIVQRIGVRTERAAVREVGRVVRAFGTVEASTRLESVVASRVEGWIEHLAVSADGDRVQPGDLLYRIFSPDLLAAQQDYLAAIRAGGAAREASAARRLRSLGMQAPVVQRLARERTLIEEVPVYAEAAGVAADLAAREGAYVAPGDHVMRLQSYEEVWVVAAVAEKDVLDLVPGTAARLDFPSVGGAGTQGRVDYVYPEIDPGTRTGRVRIVIDNADGRFKPGAYADVTFEVQRRARLVVPGEAVLRNSRGAHVIIALGGGRFAGRTVTTGVTAAGRTEVLDGLDAGAEVVVSGQFMLDSEASLQETLRRFGGADAHRHDMDPAPQMSPTHEHMHPPAGDPP